MFGINNYVYFNEKNHKKKLKSRTKQNHLNKDYFCVSEKSDEFLGIRKIR